ncbi:MAG: hypothetical protein U0271_36020 [Polyangiaceae bacterium]
MHRRTAPTLALFFVTSLFGCGDRVTVGGFDGGGGAGGASDGGGGAGGASDGGGGASSSTASIDIHFKSTTAPFAHADGLAGQTPSVHKSGLRSLTLLRDANDPSPFVVFDLGQDSIEIDYADGADTLVYTAHAADLPAGTFTVARVVHNYVRYDVAATLHNGALMLAGTFDNLQVLSDASLVDGTVRDAGYYEYVFHTGGSSFPTSGSNAPIPEWQSAGGFSVRFENGEWAYYFPVSLPLDPNLAQDASVTFEVNMHESFRWQDQALTDYATGVFDVTPTSFEPVMQFGANSFAVTVDL